MADPSSDTLVEEKQKEKAGQDTSFLKDVGNINGFFTTVLTYAVGVLVIGYVGATVINITNLSGKEIDDLFPTELGNFPYTVPEGRTNPSGDSIADLFSSYNASEDMEHLTRATLEFIFPMKRLSFPYKSWFLSKEFKGTTGHIIAQWFASTCAGTFCAWRKFYKILIVLGKWFHTVAFNVSDFVLFYIFPYIAIYVIMLPIIPFLGMGLALLASSMYNIPGAWMFTFAPFMGILLAVSNILAGGFFNFFAWIMAIIIFFVGWGLGWVNLAWWFMIGCALWLYTVAFLALSPLLHKGGLKNVVKEFVKHKKSLLAIFTVLVVVAAFSNLSKTLTTGFAIGALVCFFIIFKMPSGDKAAAMSAANDAIKRAKDLKAKEVFDAATKASVEAARR